MRSQTHPLLPVRAIVAALVICTPQLRVATGNEASEQISKAKEWDKEVREDEAAKARYWVEKAEEDARDHVEERRSMAELKERAKGLDARSTPEQVSRALGKTDAELNIVTGIKRSTQWSYLRHSDDDCHLEFKVRFDAEEVCTVVAQEKTREEAAGEPRHVMEGEFDSFYPDYPSCETSGFSCKNATIDGMPVGNIDFVVADGPRVRGRMGPGAKVKIVYHGKAGDFLFLRQRALSLESMTLTGLPDLALDPPPERQDLEAPPAVKVEYRFPPRAQKTVDLLKREIVPLVDYKNVGPEVVFADIRKRLEKLGVTHRYATRPPPEPEPPTLGGEGRPEPRKVSELKLRNVSLFELMSYFGDIAYWGWAVYPDGSIFYRDAQCGCGYPKDGRHAHTGSYVGGLSDLGE